MEKNNSICHEDAIIEIDPSFYDDDDDEETIIEEERLDPIMDPTQELKLLTEDMNVNIEDLRNSMSTIIFGGETLCRSTSIEERDNVAMAKEINEPSTSSMGQGFDTTSPPAQASVGEDSELKRFYINNHTIDTDDDDEDYMSYTKSYQHREARVGTDFQVKILDVTYDNTDSLEDFYKNSQSKNSIEEANIGNISGEMKENQGSEDSKSGHSNNESKASQNSRDCAEMEELLWAPSPNMTDEELDAYIYQADKIIYSDKDKSGASTSQTKVSELALYFLMKCDYVSKNALDMLHETVKTAKNAKAIKPAKKNLKKVKTNKTAKKNFKKHLKKSALKKKKGNAPEGDNLPPKEKKQDGKKDFVAKYLPPREKKKVSYKGLFEECLSKKNKKRSSKEDSDEEYVPPKQKKRYRKKGADEDYRPPMRPKK